MPTSDRDRQRAARVPAGHPGTWFRGNAGPGWPGSSRSAAAVQAQELPLGGAAKKGNLAVNFQTRFPEASPRRPPWLATGDRSGAGPTVSRNCRTAPAAAQRHGVSPALASTRSNSGSKSHSSFRFGSWLSDMLIAVSPRTHHDQGHARTPDRAEKIKTTLWILNIARSMPAHFCVRAISTPAPRIEFIARINALRPPTGGERRPEPRHAIRDRRPCRMPDVLQWWRRFWRAVRRQPPSKAGTWLGRPSTACKKNGDRMPASIAGWVQTNMSRRRRVIRNIGTVGILGRTFPTAR